MRLRNDILWNILYQRFLGLQRVLAVGGQTETFAYAEDVRVHGHRWLVPYNGTNDIRSLTSYTLQRL